MVNATYASTFEFEQEVPIYVDATPENVTCESRIARIGTAYLTRNQYPDGKVVSIRTVIDSAYAGVPFSVRYTERK